MAFSFHDRCRTRRRRGRTRLGRTNVSGSVAHAVQALYIARGYGQCLRGVKPVAGLWCRCPQIAKVLSLNNQSFSREVTSPPSPYPPLPRIKKRKTQSNNVYGKSWHYFISFTS